MAGIDKTNLRAMATDIAKQLDRKDSKGEDGKIEASIWNAFVADKGGKQIKNSITLENAIKSITTYITRNASKTGEAFGDLADKWFNANTSPTEETTPVEDTKPVNNIDSAKNTSATNPSDKAPASELPPQKFKFPVQEVKPLYERTEEALDIIFCGPGRDIMNKRKTGLQAGIQLHNSIVNPKENWVYTADKGNAAYAFLEIMKLIPDLGKVWNANAELVLKNLYKDLIERAKDLKIDILKETNLRTIDFDKANSYDKVTICREISEAVQRHDQVDVNEMNMFESISKPNPELAYQIITDKISGKVYRYDGNGRIKEVVNPSNGDLLAYSGADGTIYLKLPTENGVSEVSFDKDGILQKRYTETIIAPNGEKLEILRNKDGEIEYIRNLMNGDLVLVDTNGDDIMSASNGVTCHYDRNGNLKYYFKVEDSESELENHQNSKVTFRDKDGVLIGTQKITYKKGEQSDDSCQVVTYRDSEGNLLATAEYYYVNDGDFEHSCHKDANGNEITEEQFEQLVDERLRSYG